MLDLESEIVNLREFQRAMQLGGAALNRGLWHGTSASVGAYRRDFLQRTPVNIRDRNSRTGSRVEPGFSRKTLGRRFHFGMNPPVPPNIKRRGPNQSAHVTADDQVFGEVFTYSVAAKGLETGPLIRPDRKYLGIPIARVGAVNAAKIRAGQTKPRAKPSWRTLEQIKKKKSYNLSWQNRGSHIIVWAKKRRSDDPPFPVMLMVRRVKMPDEMLKFVDLFRGYESEILKRYKRELGRMNRWIVRQANRRGRG